MEKFVEDFAWYVVLRKAGLHVFLPVMLRVIRPPRVLP